MQKAFLNLSLILAVVSGLTGAFPLIAQQVVVQQSQRQPNVVIIFTDDQGTLDANCFGSTDLYTPAIDSLARSGVRFTQAYSHTVCCPARAMLMTGRQPQRSNVNDWMQGPMRGPKGRNMLRSELTLAEVLKDAGYRTALYGKWHLGAHPGHGPRKQGFDEFFGIRDGFIDNFLHFQLHRHGYHDLYEGTREVFHRGGYFPDLMTDRALAFIDRNQDRPFFLYYALNIPHYPEQPVKRFRARYEGMAEPRRSYAAMVSTTDNYIRRILTQLDALNLRENTIVVFMSDNGHSDEDYQITVDGHTSGYRKGSNYGANGGGGNTGKWIGAKGSFLEGGIRVPAILSYPARVPKNIVRGQAITAMDWYPTILELAGVDPPKNVELDGHSVMPLIRDANAKTRYGVMHWQWQDRWMVRDGDWKLLVNARATPDSPPLDEVHLGSLADDQPERRNHAKEQPQIVQRLTSLHEEWVAGVTPEGLEDVTSLP